MGIVELQPINQSILVLSKGHVPQHPYNCFQYCINQPNETGDWMDLQMKVEFFICQVKIGVFGARIYCGD